MACLEGTCIYIGNLRTIEVPLGLALFWRRTFPDVAWLHSTPREVT